ncbi:hypothetical protein [Peristeroidobacter soli]|uniref:hypothetical protein n=1 Tax=Peristeroidobacter soli TaxID=2497877 RepID=UPI00101DD933|nr:hypothetical protein [Peristeroidobacter soli]
MENLGLVPADVPSLHLMVNGCRLGLHSDFHNGVWGYVYSLTRWDRRKFSGGETLLLRDGVPSYKRHHVHGEVLYELVPANFNQLLIFDDRIVHGTPVIEGSMDPVEGRIALVGHIRATSPMVDGSIAPEDARRTVKGVLPEIHERIRGYKDVQGTVVYRLHVAETGMVESIAILTDNLVTQAIGYDRSEAVSAVRAIVQKEVARLQFGATNGKTTIIVPVLIPLPDLRPIEFTVPHGASCSEMHQWASSHLHAIGELDLRGGWEGWTYVVTEPISGCVRIEPGQVVFSFDAPMWVPSQRESFQTALRDWAAAVRTDAQLN